MSQVSPQCGSLILWGPEDASRKQKPTVTVIEVLQTDLEVTQSSTISAISVREGIAPKHVPTRGPRVLPKPQIVRSEVPEPTARQKWGYADPEVIPLKPIFSKKSEHTVVHKGFGRFMPEKEPVVFEERIPFYPPLPNAAYNFLNKNIEPRGTPVANSSFDGAALVREYILQKNAEGYSQLKEEPASPGEQAADKIDWTHRLYTGEEKIVPYIPGFCIAYWRKDLVTAVDTANSIGEIPYEMCNKCQKRHIAWGPPIDMHNRDTCFSKLPAWFPADEFDEPWNAFRQIINTVVRFEEIEQGRLLDPNRMMWNKSFHEPSPGWVVPGRVEGGWWKCRTGNGGEETDVSTAERHCRLCNSMQTQREEALEARRRREAAEKFTIHAWIGRCMEIQMMKDRAVVEARIRHGQQ